MPHVFLGFMLAYADMIFLAHDLPNAVRLMNVKPLVKKLFQFAKSFSSSDRALLSAS
jgi:hypothetical protein